MTEVVDRVAALAHSLAAAGRWAVSVAGLASGWGRPRPRADRVDLSVLAAKGRVTVDRWGVPHVDAGTDRDVFALQGYAHAEDRLWQMETQRRLGQGRLAELVGPDALDGDRFAHTVGLAETASREVDTLDPATADALNAYVAGINARLAESGPLPWEFRLAGIRPAPWTPVDVLTWAKTIGFLLSEDWTMESLLVRVLVEHGTDTAATLLAPSRRDEAARALAALAPHVRAAEGTSNPALRVANGAGGGASNAWALAGSRTASGSPVLACDPHLDVELPPIWYLNHLRGPELHATGASIVGLPGVFMGHNEHVAWAMTNARVDVADLCLERLGDDDPWAVRTDNGWDEVTVRHEPITVRGRRKPHVETVRRTPNGPIVSDFVGGWYPAPGMEVALAWTGHQTSETLSALLAVNRARDWQEFHAATRHWKVPVQNIVYADVNGTVGYALAGTVPARAAEERIVSVPSMGWKRSSRHSEAPVESLSYRNPDEGFVASANTAVGDLPGAYVADHRLTRIRALLDERHDHDVPSCRRIQLDDISLPGLRLRALAHRLATDTPQQWAAQQVLADWDGAMSAHRTGAAVALLLRDSLVREAHAEVAALGGDGPGAGAMAWTPKLEFLDGTALGPLLDRLRAPQPGDDGDGADEALLSAAWERAVHKGTRALGPDVATWTLERLRPLSLAHPFGGLPLLGRWTERRAHGAGGDQDTVSAISAPLDRPGDATSFSGSGLRQIMDLADWDNSRCVLAGGQSGHALDEHYSDLLPLWCRGADVPMPFSRDRVSELGVAQRLFVPEASTRRKYWNAE